MFEGSDSWGHDMLQFNCEVALCDILGTIRLSLEFMVQLYIHALLFHIRRFIYLPTCVSCTSWPQHKLSPEKNGNVSRNIYLQFHGYLYDSLCSIYIYKYNIYVWIYNLLYSHDHQSIIYHKLDGCFPVRKLLCRGRNRGFHLALTMVDSLDTSGVLGNNAPGQILTTWAPKR